MKLLCATNKPKLLIVLPASTIGGAETRTVSLLRGMQSSFDTALLTQSAIAGFYSQLGINIHSFDDYDCIDPYAWTSLNNIFKYAKAIACVAKLERADILLGMMHNGTLFVNAAKQLFCLQAQPIGTILGNISAYFEGIHRSPTLPEKLAIAYCLTSAKCIIVPSLGVKTDLVKNYRANAARIEVVYNGIDIERVRQAANGALSIKKDGCWIVSACRLGEQKDFSTLLQAFRVIRNRLKAKLVLVGDGELKDDILRISSDLGLEDDVILTGFKDNPFPYIAGADVFVLSSFYEGFGNVIVEAMVLGIPVVASDCPSGPGEIIQDGINGFLVPVGDYEEMARIIIALLESADLRKEISQNALIRSEAFTVNKMINGFLECAHRHVGRC
jgi:glycosyltransferase involved in cell wall biosynthesis